MIESWERFQQGPLALAGRFSVAQRVSPDWFEGDLGLGTSGMSGSAPHRPVVL